MVKAFKTRRFQRWARKARIGDGALWRAIHEMQQGLVDADLGGNLYKKRVGLLGRGKRGGARTLVATRRQGGWFFLFGFQKNELETLSDNALQALRAEGTQFLDTDEMGLKALVNAGILEELNDEKA